MARDVAGEAVTHEVGSGVPSTNAFTDCQRAFGRAHHSQCGPEGGEGISRISSAGNVTVVRDAWNMGWPPATLDAFPHEISSVTLSDVQAALRTCRASAVVSVVAPGQSLPLR